MKMRTCRFISILLLISLLCPMAWAQGRKDNKPKEKAPLLSGVGVVIDICGLAMKAVGARFANMEVSGRVGLKEKFFGNTDLDITLARIAYEDFKDYTVSTLEFGPIEPKDVDPAPFLKRLEGMDMNYTDEEFPDGEYAVLALPEENKRFDFSFGSGVENYVREVITYDDGEEMETVYKAAFPDAETKASAVMEDWYHALAEANGK